MPCIKEQWREFALATFASTARNESPDAPIAQGRASIWVTWHRDHRIFGQCVVHSCPSALSQVFRRDAESTREPDCAKYLI